MNDALVVAYELLKKFSFVYIHSEMPFHFETNFAMTENNEALIRNAYAAFNARHIDGVLRLMHPDVQWPNGWEGGYVNGHSEVRDYWTRQWKSLDPVVTPVSFTDKEDGRLEVAVQQLVKDKQGTVLFNGTVGHIYTITDGLITEMEILSA